MAIPTYQKQTLSDLKRIHYDLPVATSTTLGGIKIGYNQNGKKYPVELSNDHKAFVEVPWEDHVYTLPKATDNALGGIQTGYSENGRNYAVKMDGNKAYVTVPWADTKYTLPLAANGTRGGVQIGFQTNAANRNYAVQLSGEKMYVNVPWIDTKYTLPLAANGARGGVQIGFQTNAANRNYAVQLYGEQMYVNVPWTDHNTTYSVATSSTLGLVKIGASTSGKSYPVKLNGSGQMYVDVPWTDTDTKYTLPLAANGTRGGVQVGFSTNAANRNYAVQLSGEKMYVNVPWTDYDTNMAVIEWSVTYNIEHGGNATIARPNDKKPTNGYHTLSYVQIGTGHNGIVIRSFTPGHVYLRNTTNVDLNGYVLRVKQLIGKFSWSGIDENS